MQETAFYYKIIKKFLLKGEGKGENKPTVSPSYNKS